MTNDRSLKREHLPFVRADDLGKLNHWAVTPSGNASEDRETGFQYGREAIAFMEQAEDSTQLLGQVVHDMFKRGELGPLEAGFFDAVGLAALLYHNSLRKGWIERGHFGEPIIYSGFTAPEE